MIRSPRGAGLHHEDDAAGVGRHGREGGREFAAELCQKLRALREADVSREIEPLVGYITSLIFGLCALAFSVWFGAKLPLPMGALSQWLVPVSFFCILSGFFLIVARKRAVTQVLGFLVLENGIYTFGVGAMEEVSLLVEAGVLLDVLVAVFIMGIIIFHISREFDHIETDRLSSLKD